MRQVRAAASVKRVPARLPLLVHAPEVPDGPSVTCLDLVRRDAPLIPG